MLDVLTRAVDRFLGRGEASIAIPPMDGALKPNGGVDQARHLLQVQRPDNLLAAGDRLYLSSGRSLLVFDRSDSAARSILDCEGEILATALGPDGRVAIFDDVCGLTLLSPSTQSIARCEVRGLPIASITAATFHTADTLIVCVGSAHNAATNWQRDLLDSRRAGSIWMVDIRNGETQLLRDRLSWPAGCVVLDNSQTVLVSESWENRLILIDLGTRRDPTPVLTALPGYPSRLVPRRAGGHWLCLFAPRNQLVEFVRREPGFRRVMMEEVPRDFWVAPSLSSGESFHEPMQGGALKQMGILKPWAPTRSYGLIVELDKDHVPVASFHSRAGGRRHGLTSAVEYESALVVASKGGNELISLAPGEANHAP